MYGLIGKKLGHSYSADFFNSKFSEEGIEEIYQLFPLENIDNVRDLLTIHPDLKGFNVTIPYKSEIIPFLDYITPEAKEIGAVNVVKITHEGSKPILTGFNTDATGFLHSLLPLLKDKIEKALVLGTGGASKAIAYSLKSLGLPYRIVSRHKTEEQFLTYKELNKEIISTHHLIINTTPLGMYPKTDEAPSIPYKYLSPSHICYDLIYNPDKTLFLQKAEKRGAIIKNGLEMLFNQAIEAWHIWSDRD